LRLIWLIVLALAVALALNAERIGRHFFPFPYQEVVFHYAEESSLNPFLVAALIKTESNFDPSATSHKGALGLMQLMPETARWVAIQNGERGFSPEMLYDPETNIRIGTRYLASLVSDFGDPIIALAAYNGGRGNVKRWLCEDIWNGKLHNLDRIPFPETRQFIRKVLWQTKVYEFLYKDAGQSLA